MSAYECGFCDQDRFRAADVYIENGHCIFFASRDPELRAEANLPPDVLPSSGVIIPMAHRAGPSASPPLHSVVIQWVTRRG